MVNRFRQPKDQGISEQNRDLDLEARRSSVILFRAVSVEFIRQKPDFRMSRGMTE